MPLNGSHATNCNQVCLGMSYDPNRTCLGVRPLGGWRWLRWKVTAMRPYGYTNDRATLRDHEAKFIREAAERILNGETLRSVTAALNAEGSRTPAGNQWQPKVLKRVLVSLRVAGKEVTNGGKIREAD